MLLNTHLKHICIPIQPKLDRLEPVLSDYVKNDVALIQEVATYVIQNGGKRLRPILTLLTGELCGLGQIDILPYAAAIEFIHTASLLHDDVIDNARLRRGNPSANAKWGNAISVLVGDYFYCQASQILIHCKNLLILEVVSTAITRTTEGEVLEITKSSDLHVTEADYLKIIYHKTAVLMGTACEASACLDESRYHYRAPLRQFGEQLGMAFQLADDVLDYVSSDQQFGKQNGTDLQEGHLTLPLIYTLQQASEDERRELKTLVMAKEIHPQELKRVTAIMERYDGLKRTLDLARAYAARAKEALAFFPPSPAKESLAALTDYVIERTY